MAKTALDFMDLEPAFVKKGMLELSPDFLAGSHKDLMTRGGDFYAIWDQERNTWSTNEDDVIRLVDRELRKYRDEHIDDFGDTALIVKYMVNCKTGVIDQFHKYVQKQLRENATPLDSKLIFSNMTPVREDYSSKSLPYPLEKGNCPAWNELIGTLYSPEEAHKIEWAIGAIVTGESKKIQKCVVLYGPPGTGKSTIINVVQKLFEGYCKPFDAQKLGSRNNQFHLEDLQSNPLVAIQHDGDLSRLEDNTILNSLISHETMSTNVKYRQAFAQKYHTFIFMGTNKPVKITDAKSGLLRRIIDVHPSMRLIPEDRYEVLTTQVLFELGAIAWKCKEIFESNPKYYSKYVPNLMMGATNPFYNFILDNWEKFDDGQDMLLNTAYELYNVWCEKSNMEHRMNRMTFKGELKNYYREYIEREENKFNIYRGFIPDKFVSQFVHDPPKEERVYKEENYPEEKEDIFEYGWISLKKQHSLVDDMLSDCPAQYTKDRNGSEIPKAPWDLIKTTLKDIDTSQVHYVQPPDVHIVVDFDKKDKEGRKSLELNLQAAAKWPKTYAEVSKGGQGLHLHYLYSGDVSKLATIFEPEVEIKVYTGNLGLRRKVTYCNDTPVATISSNLPLKKEVKEVLNYEGLKNDRAAHTFLIRAMAKQYSPGTYHTMQFIQKALDEMYDSGVPYDVTDMRDMLYDFASSSHNHKYESLLVFQDLKLQSESEAEPLPDEEERPIVFYDVEVFPNLFVICFKKLGTKYPLTMINPSADDVKQLFEYRLVGFNNRDYDNHILWAASLKYSNEELYKLSQSIINGPKGSSAKFREAYNLSYTDIYDYSSNKMSLKKWEILLGIHHQELGLPWDLPVEERLWQKVGEYCCNDVEATEAVWNATQGDFKARQMLVALCHAFGCPAVVNDKTNTLTQRIIFGNEKKPQNDFQWRDISKPVTRISDEMKEYLTEHFPDMMAEPFDGPLGKSYLPYYSEYKFTWGTEINEETGRSKGCKINSYKGHNVGRGGLVLAKPGMYIVPVWTFDVASMHPSSVEREMHFGKYTKRFSEIKRARILIKHKNYDEAKQLLGGVLAPFLDNEEDAKMVAQALKIAINAVYGLTSAGFDNAFKDPRNENNIVALCGALFMFDLKCEVEERGYTVVHIKTDSIKIANPDPDIYDFIMAFGKRYGYTFEIEHKFEKICLVNNAVYIAKLSEDDEEWIGDCKKTSKKLKEKILKEMISEGLVGDKCLIDDLFATEDTSIYHPDYHANVREAWNRFHERYIEPTRWTATGTQFAVPFVFKSLFSGEPIIHEDLCMTFSTKTALYLDTNEHMEDASDLEKDLELVERLIAKAGESGSVVYKKEEYILEDLLQQKEQLEEEISKRHEFHFVGKVGQFVPIKPGYGGGWLKRQQDNKFNTVGGTDGYRWMESEMVETLHLWDAVDLSYFQKLVDDAVDQLNKFGDAEDFRA